MLKILTLQTRFSFTILILLAFTSFIANAHSERPASVQTFGIVLVYSENTGVNTMTNLRDMLEHLGLIYQPINVRDLANLNLIDYGSVAIVVDPGTRFEPQQEQKIMEALSLGVDVIWIGSGIAGHDNKTLPESFGIRYVGERKISESNIIYVENGQTRTRVFCEDLTQVELAGASASAYFVDNNGRKVFPAETVYRRTEASGKAYFFSYDIHDWWKADEQSPWMNTLEFQRALVDSVSDGFSVTLQPYPNNMQMTFICRIEDVSPLHTDEKWLTRANSYLQYYSSKMAPLSVSLIPLYVDPIQDVKVQLNATSANNLRQWLLRMMQRGGNVIQHGYTHQSGMSRSGIASDFYAEKEKSWLSLAEQLRLIELGKKDILESLEVEPRVFEAPHYQANNDTYAALAISGFRYTTHDTNTPFFHRFKDSNIINIPETLGYVPLSPSPNFDKELQTRIDELYELGGVALLINHIYDDPASSIGKKALDYSLKKKGVWLTTVEGLGEFWRERWAAYDSIKVTRNSSLTVTLGRSMKAGLTLRLTGQNEVASVKVNGRPWTLFGKDYVILPSLPHSQNTIEVESSRMQSSNPNGMGITFILMSTGAGFGLSRIMLWCREDSRKRKVLAG